MKLKKTDKELCFLIGFAFFIAMLTMTSAYAEPQRKLMDTRICEDNLTLGINQTYLDTDGNVSNIYFTESCGFGCNEKLNDCKPAPIIEGLIGFSAIFILLLLVFKLVSG